MPDITIPLWAALPAMVVVALVAAGLGAARFGTARRVLGPWIIDRTSQPDRSTARVEHIVRPAEADRLDRHGSVRVLGPAHSDDDGDDS